MSSDGLGAAFHNGLLGPTEAGGRGAGCVRTDLLGLGRVFTGLFATSNGLRSFSVVDFNTTPPRTNPLGNPPLIGADLIIIKS